MKEKSQRRELVHKKLDSTVQFPTTTNKILLAVIDFLKVHDKLDSKYWPMVDIFVERLENDIPEKKIAKDFYNAFRQAKKLQPEDKIPWYWYKRVSEVQRVAAMGRKWIGNHRAKEQGFWNILELAKLEQQKPKEMSGETKSDHKRRIQNEHFRYFLVDQPQEFPFLFATWTEALVKVPNLAKEDHKVLKYYEKMCIRLLDTLLNDPTFFFDPEHNWPNLCRKIVQQIRPFEGPVITDIKAEEIIP